MNLICELKRTKYVFLAGRGFSGSSPAVLGRNRQINSAFQLLSLCENSDFSLVSIFWGLIPVLNLVVKIRVQQYIFPCKFYLCAWPFEFQCSETHSKLSWSKVRNIKLLGWRAVGYSKLKSRQISHFAWFYAFQLYILSANLFPNTCFQFRQKRYNHMLEKLATYFQLNDWGWFQLPQGRGIWLGSAALWYTLPLTPSLNHQARAIFTHLAHYPPGVVAWKLWPILPHLFMDCFPSWPLLQSPISVRCACKNATVLEMAVPPSVAKKPRYKQDVNFPKEIQKKLQTLQVPPV